jgi:hypothetical protein
VRGPRFPAGHPPVGSALWRFTTRFEMGRGGSTTRATHPIRRGHWSYPANYSGLVWLRSVGAPTAPPGAHPALRRWREALDSAPRSPPRLAAPPVPVAYPSHLLGVLPAYSGESTHLGADFPLRCFQRFFVPDVATEPAGRPTTPPPAVRPARSSRTRASPPQYSRRSARIETELSHDVLNPARVPL